MTLEASKISDFWVTSSSPKLKDIVSLLNLRIRCLSSKSKKERIWKPRPTKNLRNDLWSHFHLNWSQIEISTYIIWKNMLKSSWQLWSSKRRYWFLILPTKSRLQIQWWDDISYTEDTNWATQASSKWEPRCRRCRNAYGSRVSFLSDDGPPY